MPEGFCFKEKKVGGQSVCHAVLTTEERLRLSAVYFWCSPSFPSLTFLPTSLKLHITGSDREEKLISAYVKTLSICWIYWPTGIVLKAASPIRQLKSKTKMNYAGGKCVFLINISIYGKFGKHWDVIRENMNCRQWLSSKMSYWELLVFRKW